MTLKLSLDPSSVSGLIISCCCYSTVCNYFNWAFESNIEILLQKQVPFQIIELFNMLSFKNSEFQFQQFSPPTNAQLWLQWWWMSPRIVSCRQRGERRYWKYVKQLLEASILRDKKLEVLLGMYSHFPPLVWVKAAALWARNILQLQKLAGS